MGERETHLLASWGETPECTQFDSTLPSWHSNRPLNPTFAYMGTRIKHIRVTTSLKMWCFVHNSKSPQNWEKSRKHGRWKVGMKRDWGDGNRVHGEMQYLEGGWAYTGFCCAVHPAGVSLQFIKSSNVKVWKWRFHTPFDVWGNGHSRNGPRKMAKMC